MGNSSGVCFTPNGHFDLNERRLSGDRQAKEENHPTVRKIVKHSALFLIFKGVLHPPAATDGSSAPVKP
jgi:hypothetical protein